MYGNLINNFPFYIAQSTDKLYKTFTYQGFSEADTSQTGVCLIPSLFRKSDTKLSKECSAKSASVLEFFSCPTSIVLLRETTTNQLHIMNLKLWIQAGCKQRILHFLDAIVV